MTGRSKFRPGDTIVFTKDIMGESPSDNPIKIPKSQTCYVRGIEHYKRYHLEIQYQKRVCWVDIQDIDDFGVLRIPRKNDIFKKNSKK